MRFRSIFLTSFLVVVMLVCAIPANAHIETLTVSEVHPGMQGIGKTVIRGTEIVEFQCEVIDVFTNMGFNGGPLILVKVWGDAIDETGGIAGGYSGSPIFIDGKLIGALSAAWFFTEGNIGGVTPIHEMLRAFTYPEEDPERITCEPAHFENSLTIDERTFDRVLLADYSADCESLEEIYGENTLIMQPCKTPLMVSGISEAGFDYLKEFTDEHLPYLDLVQGPGGGTSNGVPLLLSPPELEPGASIGAQLATGDLDLTAIGTLTWVDDDGRFLAYGHPFLQTGDTNLPFVKSKVIYTMPSIQRSFKLGEAIEIVGTVTEDRLTSIGGQLGQIPEMVDFHIKITDHDTGRTRRYDYQVINNELFLPILGLIMPMEALLYSTDRTGRGTCSVNFSIEGEGLEAPIERENFYYAYDVSYGPVMELYEAISLLTSGNQYREVKITNVDIEVEITSVRQTQEIMRARFNNPPNMGPGAIGYTGPESTEDKKAKDLLINEEAEWQNPANDETQDIPAEEMLYMDETGLYDEQGMDMMPSELVGYHPGDTIEVLVTMRPWRDEPVETIIELEIPDDFPVGITSLEIMGGASSWFMGSGMYYVDPAMGGYYGYGALIPPEDLDEVIEKFLERNVNNSVIIRLTRMVSDDPYYYLQDEWEDPEEVSTLVEVGDVITGYISLPIEIVDDTVDEPMESDDETTDFM